MINKNIEKERIEHVYKLLGENLKREMLEDYLGIDQDEIELLVEAGVLVRDNGQYSLTNDFEQRDVDRSLRSMYFDGEEISPRKRVRMTSKEDALLQYINEGDVDEPDEVINDFYNNDISRSSLKKKISAIEEIIGCEVISFRDEKESNEERDTSGEDYETIEVQGYNISNEVFDYLSSKQEDLLEKISDYEEINETAMEEIKEDLDYYTLGGVKRGLTCLENKISERSEFSNFSLKVVDPNDDKKDDINVQSMGQLSHSDIAAWLYENDYDLDCEETKEKITQAYRAIGLSEESVKNRVYQASYRIKKNFDEFVSKGNPEVIEKVLNSYDDSEESGCFLEKEGVKDIEDILESESQDPGLEELLILHGNLEDKPEIREQCIKVLELKESYLSEKNKLFSLYKEDID